MSQITDETLDRLSEYIFRELGSPSDWSGFDYDGAREILESEKAGNS